MSKTKPFSIYLLKDGFDHTNSLKEEHSLEDAEATDLPEGAQLYILDTPGRPPWWKQFFGIEKELFQATKGALIFINVGSRTFAISFGHVYHHLNDYSYEYDFGLRVTLNSLEPSELKSADMVTPGTSRRKRTQVAVSTDLTFLDFDGNSEIIKSLTGKVKDEYKVLFKNATGSTSLKVGMKTQPAQLPQICEQLLGLYDDETFKETFPNIQNISPVKDPAVIDQLNDKLVEAFREREAGVALLIPDIVDYQGDKTCCFFRANGVTSEIHPDITVEGLWDFLDERDLNTPDANALRHIQLYLCDVEGTQGRAYTVMRSLVFETNIDGDGAIYHLTDGSWYRAESAFVAKMTTYINERCAQSRLPPYNHDQTVKSKQIYSEAAYNAALPAWNNGYLCLDQTDIAPSGSSQVEPCDAYAIENVAGVNTAIFHHIKISTRSAHLSHLFNQGVNAVELLKQETESVAKLKTLLEERLPEDRLQEFQTPLNRQRFKVIFGIITHKTANAWAENLPLFSRLSLMRAMQVLEMYLIRCELTFIEDQSPKKGGHAKYHDIEVEVVHEDGMVYVRPCAGQDGFDPATNITHCPKDIRDALPGSQFRLQVSLKGDGRVRSHHKWTFDVIDDDD